MTREHRDTIRLRAQRAANNSQSVIIPARELLELLNDIDEAESKLARLNHLVIAHATRLLGGDSLESPRHETPGEPQLVSRGNGDSELVS